MASSAYGRARLARLARRGPFGRLTEPRGRPAPGRLPPWGPFPEGIWLVPLFSYSTAEGHWLDYLRGDSDFKVAICY
jgi:hypothetical protein